VYIPLLPGYPGGYTSLPTVLPGYPGGYTSLPTMLPVYTPGYTMVLYDAPRCVLGVSAVCGQPVTKPWAQL